MRYPKGSAASVDKGAESSRAKGWAFEDQAGRYDAWYDSPSGRLLFELEVSCLRELLAGSGSPRLEVGIGSGRFASALNVEFGVDPAASALSLARDRGIHVVRAVGERLPFKDGVFEAVVIVVSLCFAEDAVLLLREARRVLSPSGVLVVGAVPADSAWGRRYQDLGRHGHAFYSAARFYRRDELLNLLERTGFEFLGARSSLLQPPSDDPVEEPVYPGALQGAGFVALAANAGGACLPN